MLKLSANLGFLWKELPLEERIQRAAKAGFDAVECHFPYDSDPKSIVKALTDNNLKMLGLNTAVGKNGVEDFGVAAQPNREQEAQTLIDQAINYAAAINCPNVHVMAGKTGRTAQAESTFRTNLTYAAQQAKKHNIIILIEPINQRSAPGYHLSTSAQAVETIEAVGESNIKMMFDCFHLQISEGDLLNRFNETKNYIGHVQFAAVPDRGEPGSGEVDYGFLLPAIRDAGWDGYFGAEYTPRGELEAGLGWMSDYR